LTILKFAQLVLYIPLLALLGQGLLYVLAGPKRETNFFYTTLRLLSRPFTFVVRKITPRQVADEHVPFATFFLLIVLYMVVFFELVKYCGINPGVPGCPGAG
jgi:cytochrome b561